MEDLVGETPHKRVIKQIVEGKSFAIQLQSLLKQPNEHYDKSISADELIVKIWGSFTQAITELNTLGNSKNILAPDQIEEVDKPDTGHRCSSELKKEKQDRRGCYKRRKTSCSWVRESETMNDGCAWRKYGQKKILNSKYPRCYFRCTHKYDQDCGATKQVQIIQENPIRMYHTTYFGNHTCNSSKIPKHKHNSQFKHVVLEVKPKTPSSDSAVLKEEKEEESKGQSYNVSSVEDSNLWQDFMPSSHDSTLAPHNSSYFEMEDFGKFVDFEAIEFS